MFALTIICIMALLVLAVHAIFDLHDSVVILKSYAPEAEISRTASMAYTIGQTLKTKH